jgi:hypothetical protein
MFKKLTDLETKRTIVQAIGFYLAYLLIFTLIGAIIGGIAQFWFRNKVTIFDTIYIAFVSQIVLCLILSFLVIYEKGRFNHFGLLFIVLVSIFSLVFMNAFGGLIPIAIMTTFPSKRSTETVE